MSNQESKLLALCRMPGGTIFAPCHAESLSAPSLRNVGEETNSFLPGQEVMPLFGHQGVAFEMRHDDIGKIVDLPYGEMKQWLAVRYAAGALIYPRNDPAAPETTDLVKDFSVISPHFDLQSCFVPEKKLTCIPARVERKAAFCIDKTGKPGSKSLPVQTGSQVVCRGIRHGGESARSAQASHQRKEMLTLNGGPRGENSSAFETGTATKRAPRNFVRQKNRFAPNGKIQRFFGTEREALEMRKHDSGQVAKALDGEGARRFGVRVCPFESSMEVYSPAPKEGLNQAEHGHIVCPQFDGEEYLRRDEFIAGISTQPKAQRSVPIAKAAQPVAKRNAVDIGRERGNRRMMLSHDPGNLRVRVRAGADATNARPARSILAGPTPLTIAP